MSHKKSALLAWFSAVMLVHAAIAADTDRPDLAELDLRVRQLQQKRVVVLQNALNAAVEQYRAGTSTSETVFDLRFELLDARLELAESKEDELALWRESCELAEEHVKLVEARFQSGRCSSVELDRARARTLQAQIEFAKTQRKMLTETDS